MNCRIDRSRKTGACNAGTVPVIASATLHHTEEPCISGSRGSGTVFFSHCSMKCIYCQNYPISQKGVGNARSKEELSEIFIELQGKGAHNINLVTPTHYLPSIAKAVTIAKRRGLMLPVVYNTSSYESPHVMDTLCECADIFLADIRYASDESAMHYSYVSNYVNTARRNIKMFRNMKTDKYDGMTMARGLIVRLLVLPGMHKEAMENISFIADEIGPSTVISVMSQYFPYYLSEQYTQLNRQISEREYSETVKYAESLGFENIYTQYISTEV